VDRPARSDSLYCLRYPGPLRCWYVLYSTKYEVRNEINHKESKYILQEQVGYLCVLIIILNINIYENVTNKSGSLILVIVLYEIFAGLQLS